MHLPVWERCFHIPGLFLLNVIHSFYSLYLCVSLFISEFLIKTQTLCDRVGLFSKTNYSASLTTVGKLKWFQKYPKHLAIIVGPGSISYKDLVKLILWSNQAGIKYISFSQINNGINPHILYEAVFRNNEENLRRLKWGKSFDILKERAKRDINGYKWEPELQVDVFRIEDGNKNILEAAEDLCRMKSPISSISLNLLDAMLQARIGVPDPDLALICGGMFSTYGYPAWHLRITELMHIRTHHNLTQRDFLSFLERYNNCEQRFGK